MEASGHGLTLEEFVSHLGAWTVLFMSLKKILSNSKPKSSTGKAIRPRIVDILSLYNVSAVVWLPILV